LLEIGSARGDFLRVAGEYFDVKGVEPNPELADFASRAAPVHRDIIERTPWTGFDVIASFHVIEHVDSPKRFIAAVAERLNPGGLLVLETPDIESLPFRLLKARWRQFIPEHYFFFDSRTMRRLLNEHGLHVEQVMTIGKYASTEFLFNRAARYFPWLPSAGPLSRLTFRINPRDIMLVFATRRGP
jgi:cyclopropane fatty-acyl-phospholipid synthase-like methyltransferase